MGCLIVAAQSHSGEELKAALSGVRVIGNIRQSENWWWAFVFHLHFKELHQALSSYEKRSLSAYAGDSAWKLSLFGPDQNPFSLWFDASLASSGGIEKAKVQYDGRTEKIAQQFGLSKDEKKNFVALPFEDAVSRLLELQVKSILDAFQRFSITHDPVQIREILLRPTSDELESELGNLPRFLNAIGLAGLFE